MARNGAPSGSRDQEEVLLPFCTPDYALRVSGTKRTQTGRAMASVAPVGVSVPFCGSMASEWMSLVS